MPLAATPRAAEDRSPFAAAADALWLAAAALLAGIALLLLLRRCTGALAAPLPPAGMAAAGVAAATLTAAVRLGWRRRSDHFTLVAPWFAEAVATTCLAAFAIALSVPDAGALGFMLLWLPVAMQEFLSWHTLLRRDRRVVPGSSAADPRVVGGSSAADGIGSGAASYNVNDADVDAPPDETVLQQLARRITDEGVEEISGWLRLPLQAGQQSGNLHVAFCPPLAAPPEVEVEQADGPAARIKVAQAQAYGARLDVKLCKPTAEATSLLVQFFARSRV